MPSTLERILLGDLWQNRSAKDYDRVEKACQYGLRGADTPFTTPEEDSLNERSWSLFGRTFQPCIVALRRSHT